MRNLLVAVAVTTLLFASFAGVAQSDSKSKTKVKSLRGKLSEVYQDQNELKKEIAEKREDIREQKQDIASVDQKLDAAQAKLDATRDRLDAAKDEQAKIVVELREVKKEVDKVRGAVGNRIRAMYMQGAEPMMAALVRSKTVEDLAARRAMLERIAERDRSMFENYRTLQRQVEERKLAQDAVVKEIASLEGRQREEAAALDKVLDEKQSVLAELNKDHASLARELDQLEAQSARLESQIRSFQSSGQGFRTPPKGKLLMPTNGRMGSGFGMRMHPILRYKRMHNGIDIGAASGTPIRAAAAGRVMTASSMRGYGNTVVLDHGGGMSTLYAHCSRLKVRAGQTVKQGEVIALVGSTGLSTGPHLHFEVRINGRPVNPRNYL